jgi:hypothetical protein
MNLKPAYQYKPSTREILKLCKAALRVCLAQGFDKITGVHFWKTLFLLIAKNPRGILIALEYAAFYVHFSRQSKYLIEFTNRRVEETKLNEEKHNQFKLTNAYD